MQAHFVAEAILSANTAVMLSGEEVDVKIRGREEDGAKIKVIYNISTRASVGSKRKSTFASFGLLASFVSLALTTPHDFQDFRKGFYI